MTESEADTQIVEYRALVERTFGGPPDSVLRLHPDFRDGARYVSKALLVVAGIRADGNREILGAKIAEGEDGLLWEGHFDELKARGLHGVKMVISDGHKGIMHAVQHSFTGAAWQLCQVHFMKNILKTMAKKHWPEVSYEMKAAMNRPTSHNPILLPVWFVAGVKNDL